MINDDIHSTNVIEEIKSKPNVRVLDNTEAFKFVDFDNEKGLKNSKLEKIITTIFNSDVKEYDSPTNQFLFGSIDADGKRINDGAFDIISKKFAAATKGNVIAIVPDAKSAQVFGATELPALMENPDVHSINGIDKSDLLALAKNHHQEPASMYDIDDFAGLLFWVYWGGMFLLVGLGWLFVKALVPKGHRWWVGILLSWAIMAAFIVPVVLEYQKMKKAGDEYRARYQAAKAVFDEQCKQAGEKIYKTVDNVEGVMLLKVRPDWDAGKYNPMKDPMWPDAAMANEYRAKAYIASFLPKLSKNHGALGYAYVDVLHGDKTIIRYSGAWSRYERPLDENVNPPDPARYAVTYENNIDPGLRQHWVAGTIIQVLDRQTNELLAEKIIFAFEPGLGAEGTGRQPWLSEEVCPEEPEYKRHTILFTNKILIPKGENNDH